MEARPPEPFAVLGAAVFDGSGGPVLPDRTVVVRDGRIERVGKAGELDVPAGVRVVDGTGATLLPGLIDLHVHLDFARPEMVLAGGVTTVRDLGWPAGRLAQLRRHAGQRPSGSPRLRFAGQIVTAPGGYPTRAAWAPAGTAIEVDGPRPAADAVTRLASAGAAVIKVALDERVGPTLPLETLAAVVRAAGGRGLGVTAHVAGTAEVVKALDAGVGELAHWPFGAELPADLVRRMAASLTVVPTLHIDPTPARRRGVAAFVAAGGRVLYGTDLGNQGPPPGVDVAELALLVEAGLPPAAAMASATALAAGHLGLPETGRVAVGQLADLLLVDGDPLADLEALTRIRLVSRAGWIAA
jgi:imidazolonepropionase-like amidohydrolase